MIDIVLEMWVLQTVYLLAASESEFKSREQNSVPESGCASLYSVKGSYQSFTSMVASLTGRFVVMKQTVK